MVDREEQTGRPSGKTRSALAIAGWVALAIVAALPLSQAFFEVTNAYWSAPAFAGVAGFALVVIVAGAPWWRKLGTGQRIAWCIYALAASATALLGGRVERTEWYYYGNYEQNAMGEFVPADFFWVPAFALFILALALSLLRLYDALARRMDERTQRRHAQAAGLGVEGREGAMRGKHARVGAAGDVDPTGSSRSQVVLPPSEHAKAPRGQVAIFVVAWISIFACWLPFFFAYYPGAIYQDSLSSIEQALGMRALTDHHPVAYTMLLGIFLRIGEALGSYQLGCGIYTICQMLFMSGSIAFLVMWLRRRGVPIPVLVFVWAYFALLRIFPLHAISMWKDGLYATFLLLVAIALFDVAASRGAALARPGMLVRLAVLSLAVCLVRNNGIYVMSVCWLVLFCAYGLRKLPVAQGGGGADGVRPRRNIAFMGVGAACIAAYLALAGPGFAALGIRHVPVESYAVPLQQASAVVVFEGQMTPEQEEFMDTLLPLDKYREEYLPCSVDGIKWAPDFDTKFFEENRREFLSIWAQMMVPNAKIYLDAYVLETYEYWSFGDIQRNGHIDGVNTKNEQEDLGIVEENKLKEWFGEDVAAYFPFNFVFPCEGVVAWLLLFLALRQVLSGRPAFALMLAPALLSWCTLLISAPFAGLQRYALPSAFILPAALLLPILAARVCALWQEKHSQNLGVD